MLNEDKNKRHHYNVISIILAAVIQAKKQCWFPSGINSHSISSSSLSTKVYYKQAVTEFYKLIPTTICLNFYKMLKYICNECFYSFKHVVLVKMNFWPTAKDAQCISGSGLWSGRVLAQWTSGIGFCLCHGYYIHIKWVVYVLL